MVYATFNIVSAIYHTCAGGSGGFFFATFNNVSVIYHSFAVGRRLRRLMFYDTFNIVSIIFHTCAIGRGVGGSADSCLLPLSIMFQSFNTHILSSGLSGGSCFMPLSIFSHLPQL